MREVLLGYEIKQRNLDFSECSYFMEVHNIIREELELPEWYGANYDALWDSLTGIMYTPAEITIHRKVKKKEFEPEIQKIIEIFLEAQEEYDEIIVHVVD